MSSSVLKHQHTSLQFSDPPRQQRHDARKLFERGKQFPIKTGTESGPDNALHDALREFADEFNHVIHFAQGNWVAIDRDIIKPRSMRRDRIFVTKAQNLHGRQRDREFPTIKFAHSDERLGRIAVGAFHYSTHGKLPIDPNYESNRRYAKKIAEWMERAAKGTDIAIGAGDFNMIDKIKRQDWAFGEEFTSMADELGTYKDTGHGPIDGFVSFDRDRRVKAKKFEVLRDNKLKMFSDHFVCRGTWTVRHLKL